MRQQKKTSRVKKVIIPAAGLGTRFLPATKAMPKEMLPVVDKPIIQYVVEEAVASGIEDVILVTGQNKRAIEDHFDSSADLIDWLEEVGKHEVAEHMRKITSMANFIYVRQKGPYGNGTPILSAKHVVGNEPFAVLWGDEFHDPHDTPRLKQLIEVFTKYGDPVITGYNVDDEGTTRYGIIDGIEVEDGVFQVKKIVEKPGPEKAPSRLASLGGFVFTPDIFNELERVKPGRGNEIWLVDAIVALSEKRPIYAKRISAEYYDTGSKLGWLRANLEMGLTHPEFSKPLTKIIEDLL